MNRFLAIALSVFLIVGCGGSPKPGVREFVNYGEILHLADGVFIYEKNNGNVYHYLIESSAAKYEVTADGLDIVVKGDGEWNGTFSTKRAPLGSVVAYITLVPGEGPEFTRFSADSEDLESLKTSFTSLTTVEDVYKLKK